MSAIRATVAPVAARAPVRAARDDAAASVALLGALSAIVGGRWLATTLGLDPLAVGLAFGVALGAAWLAAAGGAAGARLGLAGTTEQPRHIARAVAAGLVVGLALIAVAIAGAALEGTPVVPGVARPAAPFLPWAAVSLLVAAAEEGILRGVLFDRLRGAGGVALAVAVTTVAFALLHVPLYGWHVVPLDLAVGLALAGLRLSTRTVLAPAAAHAVADLATWWL